MNGTVTETGLQADEADPVKEALSRNDTRRSVVGYLVGSLRVQPHVADDLFQTVALRALQGSYTYNPEKASVIHWLMGIARNVAMENYRQSSRQSSSHRSDINDCPAKLELDDEVTAAAEARETVQKVLPKLSSDDRAILRLRFLKDVTYQEIAQELTISEPTARQRVSRALIRANKLLHATQRGAS